MAGVRSIQEVVASAFSAGRAIADAPLSIDRIHQEHADFVWRTLQRLGVRDSDLEDALQEVFIVVHRKLDTFDRSSRLTTWLYGISVRVAAAHRRRAHVRRERATAEVEESPDSRPSHDPEAALAAREARERLARALDALTLEKRAVLVMFEIEGLSAGVIAEMMGVPVGTIYSRLSSARADFARVVARQEKASALP